MVRIALGVALIGLGLLGFTAECAWWLNRRNINQRLVNAAGILGILIGTGLIGERIWSIWPSVTPYKFYQPPIEPPIAALADVDPDNPKRYFSDDRKCSSEFPGPARHQNLSLSSRVHDVAFICEDGRETYCISRADLAETEPDLRPSLDEFVENYRERTLQFPIAANGNQRVIQTENIEQDGVSGRLTNFQIGPSYTLLTRLFLFEGDMYLVTIFIGNDRRDIAEAKQFLTSLRFHPTVEESR